MHWVLVFVGGGLGAAARHGVNRLALAWFGPSFPWGTLAVNVAGSFLMGLLASSLVDTSSQVRLFLATGVLGGFTTFSAFSLDALTLWQRGEPGAALAYIAASLILSLSGIVAGYALGRLL
jgi:CrcB protein